MSDDLLHWEKLGKTLTYNKGRWDDLQKAGYIALQDYKWGGSYEVESFNGRYWFSYLGGKLSGYETDPMSIGMAWTKDPSRPEEWNKLEDPVLTADQPDARYFEKLTLYKSNVIRDPERRFGYPFIMYYNAKTEDGYERITMALSKNMTDWVRYGEDPQIAKIGDLYVMFYFGAFYRPGAFDTFAHKPWVIMHEGVVYHYYCAVGDQGRVIALATSSPPRD